MISITDTDRKRHYIAAGEITRLVERQYSGGGTIVILRSGGRIETYAPIGSVHNQLKRAEHERSV